MARRAVIDVGTNSVKLLVADVRNGSVEPLLERGIQTRLGSGFYETRALSRRAIDDTAAVVAQFTEQARQHQVESIRAIATSAAREANNAADLIAAIRQTCGLTLEVIDGDREALWAFEGVTASGILKNRPVLILDVGGGSSEFILGEGQRQIFRRSYPLGIVRVLEKVPCSDPPTESERDHAMEHARVFLESAVSPDLERALREVARQELVVVGTGGSACVLMAIGLQLTRFDRERLERGILTRSELERLLRLLWGLPIAERRRLPGLPPERADIILTGAAIYAGILATFGFEAFQVSTRGLRFGAIAHS